MYGRTQGRFRCRSSGRRHRPAGSGSRLADADAVLLPERNDHVRRQAICRRRGSLDRREVLLEPARVQMPRWTAGSSELALRQANGLPWARMTTEPGPASFSPSTADTAISGHTVNEHLKSVFARPAV
jgi:hypothetical protein